MIKKIIRNTSTPELKEIWSRTAECAKRVDSWPDWKRAGINEAQMRSDIPPPGSIIRFVGNDVKNSSMCSTNLDQSFQPIFVGDTLMAIGAGPFGNSIMALHPQFGEVLLMWISSRWEII